MSEDPIINVRDIVVGERVRQFDPEKVDGLLSSIREIGLKTPINVRAVPNSSPQKFELIAGRHRLEAWKRTGAETIKVSLFVGNDKNARLWEIDENLCRNELSPAERAVHVNERKKVYEENNPETRHGGNTGGPYGQFVHTNKPSFAADTASVIGRDERSVRRDAERGEKVIPEVINMISGSKLDTGTYLDKLKRLTPNEQVYAAKRDLALANKPAAEPKSNAAKQYVEAPALAAERLVPSYDQFGAAIKLLMELTVDDYTTLCPPAHRARLFQRLGALIETFELVRERVAE